ncbi:MAG: FAD-dependent oxidoreductase [Gammaproteobacteria bacterium]|nr:FAD-dependent oxidoreductase [Gammaproteobacteria bacterium]
MNQGHIAIIGVGFAALTAAKEARTQAPKARITLIGRKAEFIYLPSLIWIPSGIRQPDDLRIPLDNFLRRHRIDFHIGEVTGLKDGGRTVITNNGEVTNDGLIIASGGRFIKKLPGIENAITPCEGIDAAVKIRDRLKEMDGGTIAIGFGGNPKEPSAMRGGPMFEFLFGIDAQLRKERRRDKFNIVFFNPAPEPGKRLGPKAVKRLLSVMAKRDIKTYLGHKMKSFENGKVTTEGAEFDADLILFMPGMTGNQWFDNSELPRSPGGLVEANANCSVPGFDKVYVAGDSGSFPGPEWMPKQAHMADIQAKAAVTNLLTEFDGKEATQTFTPELMCIVDSGTTGMYISRTPSRNIVMPPTRIMHWMKRFFEWWYLRQYR